MKIMTAEDIALLERQLMLMEAAGRTHLPVPFATIRKLIACVRRIDPATASTEGHPA